MAIKFEPPKYDDSDKIYLEHPEGRKFTGTIYSFKNLGLKPRTHGAEPRDKFMVRIESDDQMMPPLEGGPNAGTVRPFSVGIYVWASIGHHETRSGSKFPPLQMLREAVLDRTLVYEEGVNNEFYSFNPCPELLGVRVKYRVSYSENKNNPEKPWVNTEIIERLEDQSQPEGHAVFNKFVCLETEGGDNVAEFMNDGSEYEGEKREAPEVSNKGDIALKRKFFNETVVALGVADVLEKKDVKMWTGWAKTASATDMRSEFAKFEKAAQDGGVALKDEWGVYPGDDIPF
jgi:hypothetical protein